MYVVNNFLDIQVSFAGQTVPSITNIDPRAPGSGIGGGLVVTLPAGAVGKEIRMFCERLQYPGAVTIGGFSASTAKDLYLDRSRAMRTFTPSRKTAAVNFDLTGPKRVGTILAWLVADEIDISDDVIVTWPFARQLSPRVVADRKEDGDEIVNVIGSEARLALTINLRARDDGSAPDPGDMIYRILRAMSPQGDFLFFGRNLSEAYIIGRSTRRVIRHVYGAFGRDLVQPVVMEVL